MRKYLHDFTFIILKLIVVLAFLYMPSDIHSISLCSIEGISNFNTQSFSQKLDSTNTKIIYIRIRVRLPEGANKIDHILIPGDKIEFDRKAGALADLDYLDSVTGYYHDVASRTVTIQIGERVPSGSLITTALRSGIHNIDIVSNLGGSYCSDPVSYTITAMPTPTLEPTSTPTPSIRNCIITTIPPMDQINLATNGIRARINAPESVLRTYVDATDDSIFKISLFSEPDSNKDGYGKIESEVELQPKNLKSVTGESGYYIESDLLNTGFDADSKKQLLIRRFLKSSGGFTGAMCWSEVIIPGAVIPTPTSTLSPDKGKVQDATENLKKICSSLPGSETDMNTEQGRCSACVSGEYHKGIIGSYTAIGCIPTDLATFLKKYIFGVGLGLAGGIAFLLILWGGFTIIISQGDPQKIGQGKEIIVSATVGLLFIIFAIVILNIVGKDILQLPFLGG